MLSVLDCVSTRFTLRVFPATAQRDILALLGQLAVCNKENQFPLALMGVLAPGSAHT